MKGSLYILLFWVFLVIGCDPCEDCGEPLRYDPLVGVVFIHQDSADQLLAQITRNADSSKYYSSRRTDSLEYQDSLSDRLDTVELFLDSGYTEYQTEKLFLENRIDGLQVQIDTLTKIISRFSASSKELNAILAVINSGSVRIATAEILSNQAILTYEDSAKKYHLPLLMDGTETSYKILIEGADEPDTITFDYELFETVDDARIFRLKARNLRVTGHTFDSLAGPKCTTDECLSNETTFTVYF